MTRVTTPHESLRTFGGDKTAGQNNGYRLPNYACATCGGSTRYALHTDCKRDERGQLLVVEKS